MKPIPEKRKKKKRKLDPPENPARDQSQLAAHSQQTSVQPDDNEGPVISPSLAHNSTERNSPSCFETSLPPLAIIASHLHLNNKSQPEPDPDEDVDIFADAGEYAGMDFGSDSENGRDQDVLTNKEDTKNDTIPTKPTNWFNEPEAEKNASPPPSSLQRPTENPTEGSAPEQTNSDRLAPLASSSIASIRDFLKADKQAEAAEKKRARKEKNKKNKP